MANNRWPSITYSVRPSRTQKVVGSPRFKKLNLPDGRVWIEFFYIDGGYLLRFPRLADFEVSPDGQRVICQPAPEVSEETVLHLYFHQVWPLALSKQGQLVFHGSAVALDDAAIAFLADSGRGKSTLAAHFARNGEPFLTDDCLFLTENENGILVQPNHAVVCLWEDSRAAIASTQIELAPSVQYTSKSKILAGDTIRYCGEIKALWHVYFLGDGTAKQPVIETLSPRDALIRLVEHSFLLDTETKEMLTSHFEKLSRLVKRPRFFTLDYPRQYGVLPLVRSSVRRHLGLVDDRRIRKLSD